MVDAYGIPLNEEERLQFIFAVQNFQYLKDLAVESSRARELLFSACLDPSPAFRVRVLSHLSSGDCRNIKEEVLLHYAAGDYLTLSELGGHIDYRDTVIQILKHGLKKENNPDYHRKQCAFCLEQLKAMDNATEFIQTILSDKQDEPAPPTPVKYISGTPLERLLYFLNSQGIILDGQRIFPKIQVSTVTNRITYQQPPLQTLPEPERIKRIGCPEGHIILMFDFQCMEPTLLMHFLIQRFLLSMEDIPSGDLYQAVGPENREKAKIWFNAVINGGGRKYADNLNTFQIKIWEAIRELRQELLIETQNTGKIITIGGTEISVHLNQSNMGGKVMNRLIQGSASDIFNNAVADLHQWFVEEMLPAKVYFLLFDEVWVSCDRRQVENLKVKIKQRLEEVNQKYSLFVPLKVRLKERKTML